MACGLCVLLTALSVIVVVLGEEVTLKIKHPELDGHFRCVLPSTISVKVERSTGLEKIPELFLTKSEVVPSTQHVKILRRDTEGVVRSFHHDVHELKVLETQAYHNHTAGASFIVKCVFSDTGRMFFRLEGSLYFEKLKYRLVPGLLDTEDDMVQFETQHIAVMYSMTPVWEYTANDARGVEYFGNKDITFGVSKSDTTSTDTDPVVDANIRGFDRDSERLGSSSGHHRYRRNTNTYYIDILPIVDYSTYDLWLKRYENETRVKAVLNTYLANTLTAVDMRLQTLQLDGAVLRVKMISPVISTDPSSSPYTESIKVEFENETRVSAPRLLGTFADWVTAQTTLPAHDHAMLFTSYDLVPSDDPQQILTAITKGLANVAAMCKNGSVSLIEDKGAYQSENVAAHELGHGLGSKHDGEDNSCDPRDRYMMSPASYPQADSNLLHPWQFSSCSSTAISTYIKSLEQDNNALQGCLLREYGVSVTSDLELTAQAVCEMYYGNTSFPCRNVQNFDEICTKLRCRTTEDANCILVIPPTGTCCGTDKTCVAGKCLNGTVGSCQTDANCPLGDQPSLRIGSGPLITCAELDPAYCYIDDFRQVCCITCRGHETGDAACLYGDRADCSSITQVAQCNQAVSTQCCGTCQQLTSPVTDATNFTSAPTTQSTAAATSDSTAPTADSTASTSNSTAPTSASSPSTSSSSTARTTTKPAETVYGYKPDGFVGCFLPPCSAGRLYNPALIWALIIVCMVIGQAH